MGLLWSMESEEGLLSSFIVKKDRFSINLKVFRGKKQIASKKIVRLNKSLEVKKKSCSRKWVSWHSIFASLSKPTSYNYCFE
ncbi:MAG: hypothetical protein K1060chlam1_01333 [Candidatus Anoxychlamydiales bacterium]|nr:hypothetical protein [Candidatus Anoxychlamydiales bacterium]